MSFEVLEKDKILNITLRRPEAHNAMNPEIITGLTKVFKSLEKNKSIRAVVLRGEGSSFCAGGDLNWMRKSLDFSLADNLKDTKKLSDMYESIFQCHVPVLALIHGNVFGGGLGLVAVCDIVASDLDTKFCFSELKLGLVPSIISPYVLRKIPEALARQFMLTAEIFKAHQALTMNLVHFVGAKLEAEAFIQERLKLILSNAPDATGLTKNIIQKIKTSSWVAQRSLTVKTIAQRRVSKEGQEGMNAFFEKRKPSWQER